MKPLTSVVIIALFIGASSDYIFSRLPANNDDPAQSRRIIVPLVKDRQVVIDGIFSTGEWDDAIHFPISEQVEIYFMASAEDLYAGFQFIGEFFGEAVSEIYIAKDHKQFLNLHASGASGEGVNLFSDDFKSTKFTVGSNTDWESNPGKTGEVACSGKEYRISLNKFGSKSLKFAGGIMFVNRSMRASAHFPQGYDFKNPDQWAELILPATFARRAEFYLDQQPPGTIPEIFAPGMVSRDGIQSKLLISPDGSEIIYQNMIAAGSSPADRKISFVSVKMENDHWGLPVDIPFSLEYMNDEPALSPDGRKLFFVSNRPKDGSHEPQKMPDIWVSVKTASGWSMPQNVGTPVNTEGIEVQPFYSRDNKLYFGRNDGIYYSQYLDGEFTDPVKLDENIFKGRVRGVCISPDNDILIVHSDMPGGYGKWDLYISFKEQSDRWTKLINMGNSFNTEQPEANATFSPDGNYLFFSRGDDIYWVSAKIIEELRPKE